MEKCPCCSGNLFTACCEPIIENNSARTALELMRSRYTAYHNLKADYLLDTTYPTKKVNHSLVDIIQWAQANTWNKLEIVNTIKGEMNDSSGIVEFKAFYTDSQGHSQVHHERSTFKKHGKSWYYVEAIPLNQNATQRVGRNDPCPCGSGKKYKRCCG